MKPSLIQAFSHYMRLNKASRTQIVGLKDSWKASDVYCIGSGPSIQQTDLSRLDGKDVIFLNNAFRLADRFKPRRSIAVVSDHLRLAELRGEILRRKMSLICTTDKVFNPNVEWKLFGPPAIFVLPILKQSMSSTSIHMSISDVPGFSFDMLRGVYMGKSVVFPALQVAYWLGVSSVRLVGVDMDGVGTTYFDPNIQSNWSQFDYDRDGAPHFSSAYELAQTKGMQIINYSVGGVLNVLPRNTDFLMSEAAEIHE